MANGYFVMPSQKKSLIIILFIISPTLFTANTITVGNNTDSRQETSYTDQLNNLSNSQEIAPDGIIGKYIFAFTETIHNQFVNSLNTELKFSRFNLTFNVQYVEKLNMSKYFYSNGTNFYKANIPQIYSLLVDVQWKDSASKLSTFIIDINSWFAEFTIEGLDFKIVPKKPYHEIEVSLAKPEISEGNNQPIILTSSQDDNLQLLSHIYPDIDMAGSVDFYNQWTSSWASRLSYIFNGGGSEDLYTAYTNYFNAYWDDRRYFAFVSGGPNEDDSSEMLGETNKWLDGLPGSDAVFPFHTFVIVHGDQFTDGVLGRAINDKYRRITGPGDFDQLGNSAPIATLSDYTEDNHLARYILIHEVSHVASAPETNYYVYYMCYRFPNTFWSREYSFLSDYFGSYTSCGVGFSGWYYRSSVETTIDDYIHLYY